MSNRILLVPQPMSPAPVTQFFPMIRFPSTLRLSILKSDILMYMVTALVFPGLFQIQKLLLVDVTIPNYFLLWWKSWSTNIFLFFSNNALVTLMTDPMFHGHQYSVVLLLLILLHLSISRFLLRQLTDGIPCVRSDRQNCSTIRPVLIYSSLVASCSRCVFLSCQLLFTTAWIEPGCVVLCVNGYSWVFSTR